MRFKSNHSLGMQLDLPWPDTPTILLVASMSHVAAELVSMACDMR